MTAQASTVWAQLAGLNAAAGSVVYIGADNATPILDASNLFYDDSGKCLFIGFAYNPAYTRYGFNVGNGLVIEGNGDSYLAVGKQTAVKAPEWSVTSSNGSAQVPQYSATGDLLGRFSGRGYAGLTTPAFSRFAAIEMYAQGTTVGEVGGQMLLKVKQNAGILTTAITIAQDLGVTIAGALTVVGAIVFSGGISASAFSPSVSAAIPAIGMYSDVANNIDFAISGAKIITWTSALATFTQNLAVNSTGYIQLPNGTTGQRPAAVVGMFRYNSTSDRVEGYEAGVWQNYVRLNGDTMAGALTAVGLTSTGAVALSPANLNVVISPTGTGLVTISPATAGTLNNLVIGNVTPLAGTFTALTATAAVALSPANANVVISPTGTGLVTISPATAGTMNNLVIGGVTPLAITGTVVTGNRFVPNSATLPSDGLYLSAANIPAIAARSLIALAITNPASSVAYVSITGAITTASPVISGTGETNTGLSFGTAGTGNFSFLTTGGTTEQLRVLHTASATRYVTITGSNGSYSSIRSSAGQIWIAGGVASTGNVRLAGTTGADGLEISLQAAGELFFDNMNAGNFTFRTASSVQGFQIIHVASGVNFVQFSSGVSGANASLKTSAENLLFGSGAAIATGATAGYIMIPSCAGTPTGVPTGNGAGKIALHYDTTANKLWAYNGAWRGIVLV